MSQLNVKRTGIILKPEASRVILRPFAPASEERAARIISRVKALPDAEIKTELDRVMAEFGNRHRDLESFLLRRFSEVCSPSASGAIENKERQLLTGAYFTMEYSYESTALFNPSMVWHPDQSGMPPGCRRFILSLRATGEGHISSIAFRTGTIDAGLQMAIDPPSPFAATPQLVEDSRFEREFPPDLPLSGRVIFPSSPAESNGIEDARFVAFDDGNGSIIYYATYTAYDGKTIRPQLLETTDFLRFKISTLHGSGARNKGMALFPRKIDGRYAMISRQDNENLFLMYSDDLHFWQGEKVILKPEFPWEFVQLGNCGSPIETDRGWLVLSHGVGPMRKYAIGAFLLDYNDPSRVIGRLKTPLLVANETERNGYVPNVVYSCGAALYGREVIIPYAMSDYASSIARVSLDELLREMGG